MAHAGKIGLLLWALLGTEAAFAVGDGLGDGKGLDGWLSLGLVVYGPFLTTASPTLLTMVVIDDKQVLRDAQDDAAMFLASGGQQRGAYFVAAVDWASRRQGGAPVDELALAVAALQVDAEPAAELSGGRL